MKVDEPERTDMDIFYDHSLTLHSIPGISIQIDLNLEATEVHIDNQTNQPVGA